MQNLLQLGLVFGGGLHEEEAPYAHGGVHDVTGLEHAVEMPLDTLEVEFAVGVVGLVQHDEAEHIIFDAVPHGGIIGVSAFEVGLHG